MRALLLLVALLLVPGLAAAQGPSMMLEADTRVGTVGSPFGLTLTVFGVDRADPRIADTTGFKIRSMGTQTSMTLSRGRTNQTITFTYQITPDAPGPLSIGPFTTVVDGRTMKSNKVQVRVRSRAAAAADPSYRAKAGSDWYIEADASNTRPFEGQAFLYRVRVGSAVRSRDPSFGNIESEAFASEPGARIEQRQYRKLIESRTYTVSEVLVPLFAIESGRATIRPVDAVLPVVMNGRGLFAQTREIPLVSPEVGLDVRPLPTADRPPDFTGAVGRFTLRASLEPRELRAGETATLSIVLEGEGAIRRPELNLALPEGVKAYDEEPETLVQVTEEGVSTRLVFRKALVPLVPGNVVIPPLEFGYFDPRTERYATAKSAGFQMKVGGTAVAQTSVGAATALQPAKSEVELLGSDILPLHDPASRSRARPLGLGSPLILLLLFVPFFAWGAGEATAARRRSEGTEAGIRRGRARDAKAALQAAREGAKSDDWEAVEAALRRWLSARLDRSGAALSPDEAPAVVASAGGSVELADRLGALLGRVEAVRYGGASPRGLADDLHAWLQDARGAWS